LRRLDFVSASKLLTRCERRDSLSKGGSLIISVVKDLDAATGDHGPGALLGEGALRILTRGAVSEILTTDGGNPREHLLTMVEDEE
jgi:hypothetical protein